MLLQPLKSKHRPRFKAVYILTLHTPLATIPNLNHTTCLVVTRVPADPPNPPIQDTLAHTLLQVSTTTSAKKTTQASLMRKAASPMRKAASPMRRAASLMRSQARLMRSQARLMKSQARLMKSQARLTTTAHPMKEETPALLTMVQTLKLNQLHLYPSKPLEMKAISCIKR